MVSRLEDRSRTGNIDSMIRSALEDLENKQLCFAAIHALQRSGDRRWLNAIRQTEKTDPNQSDADFEKSVVKDEVLIGKLRWSCRGYTFIGVNPQGRPEFLHQRSGLPFVMCPAGEFLMGAPDEEGESDEHPQHKVVFNRPFLTCKYTVTQEVWARVMGENPSHFQGKEGTGDKEKFTAYVQTVNNRRAGLLRDYEESLGDMDEAKRKELVEAFDAKLVPAPPVNPKIVPGSNKGADYGELPKFANNPVETISWHEARQFCQKLSGADDYEDLKLRLMSEAQWEYACRAGTTTRYPVAADVDPDKWTDDEAALKTVAHFGYPWGHGHFPVGELKPNKWGIYDMCGNVWEWVEDEFHDSYRGGPPHGIAWTSKWDSERKILIEECKRRKQDPSDENFMKLIDQGYLESHARDLKNRKRKSQEAAKGS